MEIISSSDNAKIKHIKKLLADKKYRAGSLEYVAEGKRWVLDALAFNKEVVKSVFVCESAIKLFVEQLVGVDYFIVKQSIFEKITDTKTSQGILAVVKVSPFKIAFESTRNSKILYLDKIRDPGNLGTIIRTAIGAGYKNIILDECADVYSPKVVRSTMSALLHADFLDITANQLSEYRHKGFAVIAASLDGKNVFTFSKRFDKMVLIIGSEADGIRQEYLKLANEKVSIPMEKIESLNAAVSAGILMYQLRG